MNARLPQNTVRAHAAAPQPEDQGQRSEWLTATEAAHYLKIEPRTMLLWARQGKVKGYTLSGTRRHVWRFRHADLDASLKINPSSIRIAPPSVPYAKGAQ